MRIGALRDTITIQKNTPARHADTNELIAQWSTFSEPYAEIIYRAGREFFENGQRFNQTTIRFRCRYDDVVGVTAAMRVVFEGQAYDIRAVMPDIARRSDCIIETTLQDGVV